MKFETKTWVKWGFNIAFWLLIMSLMSYAFYTEKKYGDAAYGKYFLQVFVGMGFILMPVIYFNTLVLIPRFLAHKRYLHYVLAALLISLVWAPVSFAFDDFIDATFFEHTRDPDNIRAAFPEGVILMLGLFFISTIVNLSYRWFFQLNKIVKLENEQLNTELMLLKNQINPHFFFNTLHNLYSLVLGKSAEAPDVILKLSDMMRYTIYDCKEKQVLLSQEIEYLENYISLQQIRLYERGIIEFTSNITHEQQTVVPLLFIVFLENAFKHGIETLTEKAYIKAHLEANEHQLTFAIENNYDQEERNQHHKGGLGVENVKRRLELLYGNRHQLTMQDQGEVFKVKLMIDLVGKN